MGAAVRAWFNLFWHVCSDGAGKGYCDDFFNVNNAILA
jgi:hypothetical protein